MVQAEAAGGACSVGGRTVVKTVFRDLSERTRAEEERSRLVAALEMTRDLITLLDPQGMGLYLNGAGRELRRRRGGGSLPVRDFTLVLSLVAASPTRLAQRLGARVKRGGEMRSCLGLARGDRREHIAGTGFAASLRGGRGALRVAQVLLEIAGGMG